MKIKIKGAEWEVEFVEQMSQYEDCVCGLTKDDERKILILKGQNKKSLKDTISHELIHAYLFECGHYLTKKSHTLSDETLKKSCKILKSF